MIREMNVRVIAVPGIDQWGLPAAAGSLSVSDIPSQTSSTFWLEPGTDTDNMGLSSLRCS